MNFSYIHITNAALIEWGKLKLLQHCSTGPQSRTSDNGIEGLVKSNDNNECLLESIEIDLHSHFTVRSLTFIDDHCSCLRSIIIRGPRNRYTCIQQKYLDYLMRKCRYLHTILSERIDVVTTGLLRHLESQPKTRR